MIKMKRVMKWVKQTKLKSLMRIIKRKRKPHMTMILTKLCLIFVHTMKLQCGNCSTNMKTKAKLMKLIKLLMTIFLEKITAQIDGGMRSEFF